MAKLLDESGLLYFWGKFKSRLLPSGGSAGQVLAKSSATNYDVTWVDQSGGSVTMEDTDVDAAVEAAWPAGSYEITTDLTSYLSIDKAEASEGETVTVEVTTRIMLDPVTGLGVLDSHTHETLIVLAQVGGGRIAAGTVYTFSMPATDVIVSYCY